MEPTTPNSAATEHANDDNTRPRGSDATERATTHTHDECPNDSPSSTKLTIEAMAFDWPTQSSRLAARHSRSPQSSDVRPERRIAADKEAYSYTEFVTWYGTRANQMWERCCCRAQREHGHCCCTHAAATEHSESSSIANDTLPSMKPLSDATRRCPTQADLVQTPRDATEHSPWKESLSVTERVEYEKASVEIMRKARELLLLQSTAAAALLQNMCETAAATEHSESFPIANDALPASSTMSPQITGNLLQCVVCERPLCGTSDLAFFWRKNKQGGVEVHLMLKPENKEPAPFIRSNVTQQGTMASWQCACGFKLGDTRAVAVKRAAMTSFKSSSVMLCGHRFTGSKSQWPSIYNQPPFNTIEVRTSNNYWQVPM